MKAVSILSALLWAFVVSVVSAATPVKISVVAFGGKVTIKDRAGKSIVPSKNVEVPVGSVISTGVNSWIDLAQGGLSTIRVMAKTKIFEITESSFEERDKKSLSIFKVRKGSVFVSVNKKALGKGSKYQVQMPELIAGVVGSECQVVTGHKGDTIMDIKGDIIGTTAAGVEVPLTTGEMLVMESGGQRPVLFATPKFLVKQLMAISRSVPRSKGSALSGEAMGGTANGEIPDVDTIVLSIEGGSLEGISDVDDTSLITTPPEIGASAGSIRLDPSKVDAVTSTPPAPPPSSSP